MEEHIRRLLFKSLDHQELQELAHQILQHRKHLREKLGSDPGPLTCLAHFVEQTQAMEAPLLIERKDLEELQRGALSDDLSGLGNRRLFNIALAKEFARARRSGESFSLIMIDIDHFKDFNDAYGHLEGDLAIRSLSQILRANSRDADYRMRYGGEEFALILPQSTLDQALLLAERMRKAVELHPFNARHLTISAGIAQYTPEDASCCMLLERADKALYRAKELGRNTVCTHWADNRRSPRFKISIPVELCVKNGRLQTEITESINISRGGVLLDSTLFTRREKRHELCLFDTSNAESLEVPALVRQSQPLGNGARRISFKFLHRRNREDFERFFTSLILNEHYINFHYSSTERQPEKATSASELPGEHNQLQKSDL